MTPFLYGIQARELTWDLTEALCGARVTTNYTRIGGVKHPMPDGFGGVARVVGIDGPPCRLSQDTLHGLHGQRGQARDMMCKLRGEVIQRVTRYQERYQIPVALAILLLAAEFLLSDRVQRRREWRGRFA